MNLGIALGLGARRAMPLGEFTLTGTPPATAQAGVAYSFTPDPNNEFPPVSYSLIGDLPPGLTFNPATGAITGTPL